MSYQLFKLFYFVNQFNHLPSFTVITLYHIAHIDASGKMHKLLQNILAILHIAHIDIKCYNIIRKAGDIMAKSRYESNKNAIKKYIAEKTDEVRLRVPKGTKDRWKEYAEAKGISLTKYVVQAVEQAMENDE